MQKRAQVTERQLTEQVKRLRDKSSRPDAIGNLLDLLSNLMMRSGLRMEGQRVRRVADDVLMGANEPDLSGMGHDDTRQMAASVAERYLKRRNEQ